MINWFSWVLQRLKIRHLLDPMHIEVNVCKSIMKHTYGTNNTAAVRNDCKDAGMHKAVWTIPEHSDDSDDGDDPHLIPPWVLPKPVIKELNDMLSKSRFPTGYGAKLRGSCKAAGTDQPSGLKSHDYHKLMQHMLPVALRSLAHSHRKALCNVIYDLAEIFRSVIQSSMKMILVSISITSGRCNDETYYYSYIIGGYLSTCWRRKFYNYHWLQHIYGVLVYLQPCCDVTMV